MPSPALKIGSSPIAVDPMPGVRSEWRANAELRQGQIGRRLEKQQLRQLPHQLPEQH
jgi:hypothetical protein